MNRWCKLAAPLVAVFAITACNAGGSSNIPGGTQAVSPMIKHTVPQWESQHLAKRMCPTLEGKFSCLALRVGAGNIVPACSPSNGCGFTAQQLQTAYGLNPVLTHGAGTIVALIEAGDYAAATNDVATYRNQYGLGTANLVRYNENGQQSNYPPTCRNYGWCFETALDMDMVSAACPKCTIYVMEAKGGISDFETAEQTAVNLGATILSNSWSCPNDWDCGDSNFPNYFNHTGVAYLASTGDNAYNTIGAPSDLDTVIGVGGTQLETSGSGFTETIWNDASAGCADMAVVGANVPKPAWQHDKGCTSRTDGDISSQSGCSPGVAIYSGIYGGWNGACGTSVASPFLAGVMALKGNQAKMNGGEHFWKLTATSRNKNIHAITSGSDGSCGGSYLCTAGTGQFKTYSGPGGWGSPANDKAF